MTAVYETTPAQAAARPTILSSEGKKETPQLGQTNTGNEVDPVASAEKRKAENAERWPTDAEATS